MTPNLNLDALEAAAKAATERVEAFCDNPKADEGSLVFRCGMTLRVSELRTLISYIRQLEARNGTE
jgi:hypothetical protein